MPQCHGSIINPGKIMIFSLIYVFFQVLISACAGSPTFLELVKQDNEDRDPSTFRLAYECMNDALNDTKLRLYGVMLAKVCLEKDPYMLRYPSLLLDLLYTLVESEGDERVAAEALAAIHIAIKHNVAVSCIAQTFIS